MRSVLGNTHTHTHTHKKNCIQPVIQNKRRGMLTYGVVLLHDNARLQTAAHI
jgi:hypothetical protein